jgi:hypothetical protein
MDEWKKLWTLESEEPCTESITCHAGDLTLGHYQQSNDNGSSTIGMDE